MIHKWYRGHDGKQKATDNFGIIWITDDPEYAQLYADEYGNEGVVSVLYIDESKLNYADTYYDDDFDVWFPDMAKVKEYQKEGYNCYSFPVSVDGLDCDCIALFDESAIVKIEQLNTINENTMKSTIKLTESELKGMIEEFPDFQDNVYYLQEYDEEQKKMAALHIKSPLAFLMLFSLMKAV